MIFRGTDTMAVIIVSFPIYKTTITFLPYQ